MQTQGKRARHTQVVGNRKSSNQNRVTANAVSPFDVKTGSMRSPRAGDLNVEDVRKRLESLAEEERFLLRPDSPQMQHWDPVMLIALLFTALVTPYEVAFVPTQLDALFVINRLIDGLFLIDMGINFCLMYYHENGRLIKSHRMIVRKYLYGWFFIDFVTILPYDTAKYMFGSSQVKVVRLVRLLRLLKLLRLLRASRIFTRWQNRLGMQNSTLMALKLFCGLVACIHWFACLWALLPKLLDQDQTTWMSLWLDGQPGIPERCNSIKNELGAGRFANGAMRNDPETPGCDDCGNCASNERIYIATLQLAVMTVTGAGPGVIVPVNVVENFVCLLLVILSGVVWANIIGQICAIAAAGDPVLIELHNKTDDLNRFMDDTNIPFETRLHIRTFLMHSKSAMRERNRKEVLKNLSPELAGTLAMTGQRWIKERMVFWAGECSPSLLALLITDMDCRTFGPNEKIAAADCMYILKSGTVCTTKILMKASANTCWNTDFVLYPSSVQMIVTARTITFTEVDILTVETFERALAESDPEEVLRIERKIRWWCVLRSMQYMARNNGELPPQDFETEEMAEQRRMSSLALSGDPTPRELGRVQGGSLRRAGSTRRMIGAGGSGGSRPATPRESGSASPKSSAIDVLTSRSILANQEQMMRTQEQLVGLVQQLVQQQGPQSDRKVSEIVS